MPFLTKTQTLSLTLAALLGLSLAAPALAADPVEIGQFGAWTAYQINEDGGTVCYMAAQPEKAEGNYNRRGQIFALITHRPAEGTKNVFSYIAGYPYKAGSDVTLTIDGKGYTLFSQDDTAWAPDAATDEKIGDALRKGSKMTVKGVSSRGTATTDTFSLSGSGAAHDKINEACAR